MLHTIFIKRKVDVMYFIFIFISPSIPRFSVKKSVNQLIKNKRPYQETPNILLIQINRFNVSNLHGRPRINNHPFDIYENVKLGLINYTLLGLIEHHGVFINSGHCVGYIRQNNKWYHCDDKHITENNLLTLSNNIYLMFYAKEIDIGTYSDVSLI